MLRLIHVYNLQYSQGNIGFANNKFPVAGKW